MKLPILTIALAACTGLSALAQSCPDALTFSEGAQFEMTTYNDKDKMQSTSRHKVTGVKREDGVIESSVESTVADDKGKPVGTTKYRVKCENGIYKVSMDNFLDQNMMKGFEGMEVDVQSDQLEMPASPAEGQKLKDGQLVMKINGPMPMTNTVLITNRTVIGPEKVTTPAGTFDCIKLTYDVNTKFMVNVNTKVEEWYDPAHGMVMSRNYDQKGKLTSYTKLTSLTR